MHDEVSLDGVAHQDGFSHKLIQSTNENTSEMEHVDSTVVAIQLNGSLGGKGDNLDEDRRAVPRFGG